MLGMFDMVSSSLDIDTIKTMGLAATNINSDLEDVGEGN